MIARRPPTESRRPARRGLSPAAGLCRASLDPGPPSATLLSRGPLRADALDSGSQGLRVTRLMAQRLATISRSSVPPNATGWQGGWRYCSKCGVLFMGTNQAASKCSGGDKHKALGGTYWVLIDNSVAGNGLGQVGWRWCANCQGLWFAAVSGSRCPAGSNKAHIHSGSGKYILSS